MKDTQFQSEHSGKKCYADVLAFWAAEKKNMLPESNEFVLQRVLYVNDR